MSIFDKINRLKRAWDDLEEGQRDTIKDFFGEVMGAVALDDLDPEEETSQSDVDGCRTVDLSEAVCGFSNPPSPFACDNIEPEPFACHKCAASFMTAAALVKHRCEE